MLQIKSQLSEFFSSLICNRYTNDIIFTTNNYIFSVVVGVKFVKRNHTLYINIQQGKLLPYGYIDESTVFWSSVTVNSNENTTHFNNQSKDEKKFEFDWYERRTLHLDNLLLSKDELITGVKFSEIVRYSKNVLILEIQSTSFDPITGQLSQYSYWHSHNEKKEKKRYV